MRCNKGQALWEITLFLAMVALIAGCVIWWLLKKPSESNMLKDNAKQFQYTENHSGIRLFDFSCVTKEMEDKWGKDAVTNKTTR